MSDTPAIIEGNLVSADPSATEPASQPLEAPATAPDGGGQTPSDDAQGILSSLKALRDGIGQKATPLDLPVPGYDGLLVVRYQWVPFKDLSAGAKNLAKVKEPTELQIAASADALVTCCQEILICVEGELRPLSKTGVPATFGDPQVPEALGFAVQANAVGACRAVFNNEYALIRTANTVIEWLQDTSRRVDLDVLGN